jgi:DNA-binding winged helix-turn-helix (wHTH) protein
MSEGPILCFSRFRIDASNQELWRDSEKLEIRHKIFQVLAYLARNPHRLITHEELLNNIWTDSAEVGGGLLRAYIWELRHILGDDAKSPRYLKTVNRRGYRFIPSVTAAFAPAPDHLAGQREASDDGGRASPSGNNLSTILPLPTTGRRCPEPCFARVCGRPFSRAKRRPLRLVSCTRSPERWPIAKDR